MKLSFKVAFAILFVLASMSSNLPNGARVRAGIYDPAAPQTDLKDLCKCNKSFPWVAPQLNPNVLPTDVSFTSISTCTAEAGSLCQRCFDCYGWQLFIALNWPAASPGVPKMDKAFGAVGDYEPVVWETYKDLYAIFDNPGKTLPPWKKPNDGTRLIEATNVVEGKTLDEEAEMQVDQTWLTDQERNLVRYEIRVNKAVYEYIRKNNLYYQEGIYKAFTDGVGISLPAGPTRQYGDHGSIEVKAAWRIVPEGELETYKERFKISYANITGQNNKIPLALVGLHIIKKTPNSPQWIWATFEHKDNAPDLDATSTSGTKWSFYDPGAPPDYEPNWFTPPEPPTKKDVPVQVKREFKIPDLTEEINRKVHDLIKLKFHGSVWLNYDLVDVQWPTQPQASPPRTRDLVDGNPTPGFLANITMETYLQRKHRPGDSGGGGHGQDERSSCIGCHRLASITPTFDRKLKEDFTRRFPGELAKWPTDYSTIFYKAKPRKPSP